MKSVDCANNPQIDEPSVSRGDSENWMETANKIRSSTFSIGDGLISIKQGIVNTYEGTKDLILKQFSSRDDVVKAVETNARFVYGISAFNILQGYKYILKVTKSGNVNCLMKEKMDWIFRFDNPHKGYHYEHLNVRHKFSGHKDPHLWLPPGTIFVSFKFYNKFHQQLSLLLIGVSMGRIFGKNYLCDLPNFYPDNCDY